MFLSNLNMKTYTKAQFISYVCGWLGAEETKIDQLTLNSMNASLLNASTMLKDNQDGIDAVIERNKLQYYRFDGKYVVPHKTENEAFEDANGYHDEYSATVEKLIDGNWCQAADPVYQPQFFYGGKNGGWITNNGIVEYDS